MTNPELTTSIGIIEAIDNCATEDTPYFLYSIAEAITQRAGHLSCDSALSADERIQAGDMVLSTGDLQVAKKVLTAEDLARVLRLDTGEPESRIPEFTSFMLKDRERGITIATW